MNFTTEQFNNFKKTTEELAKQNQQLIEENAKFNDDMKKNEMETCLNELKQPGRREMIDIKMDIKLKRSDIETCHRIN